MFNTLSKVCRLVIWLLLKWFWCLNRTKKHEFIFLKIYVKLIQFFLTSSYKLKGNKVIRVITMNLVEITENISKYL